MDVALQHVAALHFRFRANLSVQRDFRARKNPYFVVVVLPRYLSMKIFPTGVVWYSSTSSGNIRAAGALRAKCSGFDPTATRYCNTSFLPSFWGYFLCRCCITSATPGRMHVRMHAEYADIALQVVLQRGGSTKVCEVLRS